MKVPSKPAGAPTPKPSPGTGVSFSAPKTSAPGPAKTFDVGAMKQAAGGGGGQYDYVSEIPQGSNRPWEATGSGGYKAPKGTGSAASGQGASGSPGTKGPSVEDRSSEAKPVKTPQDLSSKQSILSSDSKDFKDHTVADHYKIMSEVGHDDKLSAMHQKHIQEKTKNFTSEDHSKLSGELRDAHEKSPDPRLEMAAEYHEGTATRTQETKATGKTSATSDAKKMKRDAASAKTKADAKDKKAKADEKKSEKKLKDKEAKAKAKVKTSGEKSKKKAATAQAKTAQKAKDKERKTAAAQEEKEVKAEVKDAEKAAKEKEKEDSPEMKRAKTADHSTRAQKLHENVSSHLDSGELDVETYGRLTHLKDLADSHSKLDEVTPKHAKELKEAESMAGDHGSSSSDEMADKNKVDPDVEAAKHASHKESVQSMKDNLDAHLEDEDTSELKKQKLQKIRDILDKQGDSAPTPEQESQLKELQKLAGEHGKTPPKGDKAPTDKGSSSRGSGFSGASARALGARLGAASASEEGAGDIGAAGIDYGTSGAVQAGHHLLSSDKKSKEESTKKSIRLYLGEGK